jgi:hypothetical protein
MRNLKNNLVDIIFLSILGLLLLLFIIPWPFPQIEVKSSQEPFVTKVEFADEAENQSHVSLAQCAYLFGVRPPRPSGSASLSASAKPKDTEPQKVSWLKYIGLIAEPDGEKKYYFKDTRANRIIKLSLGQTVQEWTLSEISVSHFTLKNEEKTYVVEK